MKFERTRYRMKEAVAKHAALKDENPDALTLGAVTLFAFRRFNDGYFGPDRVSKAVREAEQLRRTDPKAYAVRLRQHERTVRDLRPIMHQVRVAERLLSTDLIFAVGELRNAELNDPRPRFSTSLYNLVSTRTRTNLKALKTRSGGNLADQFLEIRPEGTSHRMTSFIASGENYAISNLELGFEVTAEALLNDELDEVGDAMEALGEAAAKTRALLLVLAAHRGATYLTLPDGSLGPNMANQQAAYARLSNQVIDGREYSRTLTDIYVPGSQALTAMQAQQSPVVVYVGGASGELTAQTPVNPVYQLGAVHGEEIFSMADRAIKAEFPNHSGKDWIAADASSKPLEMAFLEGFQDGPKMLTKTSNIAEVDLDYLGDYDSHVLEWKATDWAGAAVRDKAGIVIVSGADA